jgi:hypothetical protein
MDENIIYNSDGIILINFIKNQIDNNNIKNIINNDKKYFQTTQNNINNNIINQLINKSTNKSTNKSINK